MRKFFFLLGLLFIFIGQAKGEQMIITSNGITDNTISDEYGKRGIQFSGNMPTYSLGFNIDNPPKGAKSFAFILDDTQAVSGFPWIHWMGANLVKTEVLQNESISATDFVQGKNSWGKNQYGGMAPPDKPHRYDLHVYALDTILNLTDGFTRGELENAMKGHILEHAVLSGMYSN